MKKPTRNAIKHFVISVLSPIRALFKKNYIFYTILNLWNNPTFFIHSLSEVPDSFPISRKFIFPSAPFRTSRILVCSRSCSSPKESCRLATSINNNVFAAISSTTACLFSAAVQNNKPANDDDDDDGPTGWLVQRGRALGCNQCAQLNSTKRSVVCEVSPWTEVGKPLEVGKNHGGKVALDSSVFF